MEEQKYLATICTTFEEVLEDKKLAPQVPHLLTQGPHRVAIIPSPPCIHGKFDTKLRPFENKQTLTKITKPKDEMITCMYTEIKLMIRK